MELYGGITLPLALPITSPFLPSPGAHGVSPCYYKEIDMSLLSVFTDFMS